VGILVSVLNSTNRMCVPAMERVLLLILVIVNLVILVYNVRLIIVTTSCTTLRQCALQMVLV